MTLDGLFAWRWSLCALLCVICCKGAPSSGSNRKVLIAYDYERRGSRRASAGGSSDDGEVPRRRLTAVDFKALIRKSMPYVSSTKAAEIVNDCVLNSEVDDYQEMGIHVLKAEGSNCPTDPRFVCAALIQTNKEAHNIDGLHCEMDHRVKLRRTTPPAKEYRKQYGHDRIALPLAWDYHNGSSNGPIVAVIDTGIQYDHPNLINNLWTNPGEIPGNGIDDDGNGYIDDYYGWDFHTNTNDTMDRNGHGTHVAGIIGADPHGNVAGVSWGPKLMSLKFLDDDGDGDLSNAIAALDYAIKMGAKISSNSYGCSDCISEAFRLAIEAAGPDHLFVCAAGNDNVNVDETPEYPCGYTEVMEKDPDSQSMICVASTNRPDKLSTFSNYGSANVHVGAPGTRIYSTYVNSSYHTEDGTSMAVPYVSGLAALLMSANTSATIPEIKKAILETADRVPHLTNMTITGARINALKAIKAVLGVEDV